MLKRGRRILDFYSSTIDETPWRENGDLCPPVASPVSTKGSPRRWVLPSSPSSRRDWLLFSPFLIPWRVGGTCQQPRTPYPQLCPHHSHLRTHMWNVHGGRAVGASLLLLLFVSNRIGITNLRRASPIVHSGWLLLLNPTGQHLEFISFVVWDKWEQWERQWLNPLATLLDSSSH